MPDAPSRLIRRRRSGFSTDHSSSFLAHAKCRIEPAVGLQRKSTACGINRIPSSSRILARHLPFISSTAFRALAPPAFFREAQSCRFAFGRKNMAQHIFRSKANSKIISRRPAMCRLFATGPVQLSELLQSANRSNQFHSAQDKF